MGEGPGGAVGHRGRMRGAAGPSDESRRLAEVIRAHGVRDERLLSAIAEIPRAKFVPPNKVGAAYRDEPIAIPHGLVTTQPSLVAQMVEALELEGAEKVLEVGTGYGWQTALLARQAGAVWSIEMWPDVAAAGRANLDAAGVRNAHVVVGDGTEGLPDEAPFDAIIVTAAFTSVPPPLSSQLAHGGRLVQPIGPGGRDDVMLFEKGPEGLTEVRTIVPARFVRLRGSYGFAEER
jgi:protein-L-isoaspartate(D-aspartate) O-methyltransferase